jgi:ArsR family transcriptional regulator
MDYEATLRRDAEAAEKAAQVLKAVAHPLRLRLVATLCAGPEHVNALAVLLSVPQAVVSQQLRILRMHGLVQVERRDGFAFYALGNPKLRTLVRCLGGCSDDEKRFGPTTKAREAKTKKRTHT